MATKVLYLFGAGATLGALKHVGRGLEFGTGDVASKVTDLAGGYASQSIATGDDKEGTVVPIHDEIINFLGHKGLDMEHLLTTLDELHSQQQSSVLRRLYYRAIKQYQDQVINENDVIRKTLYYYLVEACAYRPKADPKLSDSSTLEFVNDEHCIGFMTLNYDEIFENAVAAFRSENSNAGGIYSVGDYEAIDSHKHNALLQDGTPYLKLHGSVGWQLSRQVDSESSGNHVSAGNVLWVPPGIHKRYAGYPFNALWGRASELISQAQILRVIGCSLSHNDWDLIPMLFQYQKLRPSNPPLKIEFIGNKEDHCRVKKSYQYLDVTWYYDVLQPQIENECQSIKTLPYEVKPEGNWFENWLVAWLQLQDLRHRRMNQERDPQPVEGEFLPTRLSYLAYPNVIGPDSTNIDGNY